MGVDNPFTPSILALSPDEMFGIPYSVNDTQTEQAKQGDATLAWAGARTQSPCPYLSITNPDVGVQWTVENGPIYSRPLHIILFDVHL